MFSNAFAVLIEYLFFYSATDINASALECTRKCAQVNIGSDFDQFQLVQTDLAGSLAHRLGRQVDVLVFNPPYVPTNDEEVSK